jgi:hypothetical protein
MVLLRGTGHFAGGDSDCPYDRVRLILQTAIASPMSFRGCLPYDRR